MSCFKWLNPQCSRLWNRIAPLSRPRTRVLQQGSCCIVFTHVLSQLQHQHPRPTLPTLPLPKEAGDARVPQQCQAVHRALIVVAPAAPRGVEFENHGDPLQGALPQLRVAPPVDNLRKCRMEQLLASKVLLQVDKTSLEFRGQSAAVPGAAPCW